MNKTATDDFVFARYLNLTPLVNCWRGIAEGEDAAWQTLAQDVLARVDQVPELLQPTPDPETLSAHRELIDLMMTAIFPVGRRDDVYAAGIVPFHLASFYQTPAFRRLNLREQLFSHPDIDLDVMNLGRAMSAYHYILDHCYDLAMDFDYTMVWPARDQKQELDRFFKITYNPRFCDIHVVGTLPELKEDDIQALLANRMNLELWKTHLPPEHFEFHGFVIVEAVDVTEQQVLSQLKRDLLQQDALTNLESFELLQMRLRNLLRRQDIELGLISMEYGEFDVVTGMVPIGRSLLLNEGEAPNCPSAAKSVYAKATKCDMPYFVSDLQNAAGCTGYGHHLLQQGYRNLVVSALRVEDRLVGLMELASPNPGDLHELNSLLLLEVIDLFAIALKRSLDEREDRIQAVIKEQYTAIHPVVEWRFRDAAYSYLRQTEAARRSRRERSGREAAVPVEPIVFRDVYPLYGLSDIRGSSVQRAAAIQADLGEQLGLALNIFVEAGTSRWMPALDEIGYRIATYANDIVDSGLQSGDETRVLDFLQREVEPLLDRLEGFGERTRERVKIYRDALDPELGVIYQKRKAFEDSVSVVNEIVSQFIDRQERQAQTMVPHYFEMYRTDGVDYNIYAGASLLHNGDFSPLHLQSLRLWQLMMTCGIVWELDDLRPYLKLPLDLTHLILVHNSSLAIRFRHDEKQFDVDGAYNIRYEIVKKRIDKAIVKGTGERLTQPGKIAIVYEHERDAAEYQRYIDYMQAANYIADEVEALELEDLQGVYGLRALRVTVNERAPDLEAPQPGAKHLAVLANDARTNGVRSSAART